MTTYVSPHESDTLRDLYLAGAHREALARAFGRDPRAVRAALRREGVALRREPPLPTAWQATLSLPARRGLQRYFQQLQQHVTAAWERLEQVAVTRTTETYVFAARADYDAVLDTVRPTESLPAVARRLGIDLTVVLLAYADWADEHCDAGPNGGGHADSGVLFCHPGRPAILQRSPSPTVVACKEVAMTHPTTLRLPPWVCCVLDTFFHLG